MRSLLDIRYHQCASVRKSGRILVCAISVLLSMGSPGVAQTPAATPAPSVVVSLVKLQDVTQRANFVGTVEAVQQVDLRARVEGFIEAVAFSEGDFVEKNAVLYQIERAPYSASLSQAQASQADAEAQLASAEANFKEKEVALGRQQTLARQQFASQAVLDQATAERDQAAAAIQQAIAQIQSSKAQIETANLNISYTTVRSPISGRIGKTAFTAGNLVSPSSGVLATVVQMSPIRVSFPIPEKDYVTMTKFLASPEGKAASETDDLFKPHLVLPDGSSYSQPGRIEFINNQIDSSTGTLSVRAIFENPINLLLPGQYVSVTVQIGEAKSLPVVPQAAVLRNQQGPYVFIVDKDDRAQIRQIETGIPTDTGYAVTKGLQQGEAVIVSGIQKVRAGTVVQTTTAAAQPSDLKP